MCMGILDFDYTLCVCVRARARVRMYIYTHTVCISPFGIKIYLPNVFTNKVSIFLYLLSGIEMYFKVLF